MKGGHVRVWTRDENNQAFGSLFIQIKLIKEAQDET